MRSCILIGILTCLASQPGGGGLATDTKPAKPKSVAEQLAAIQKEQKTKQEQLTQQLEKLQAELENLDEQTAARYLELVRKFPIDPGVLPALEYLVLENTSHAVKALAMIEQHHLQSPRLGKLCLVLSETENADSPRTEKFLRAVIAKNTTGEVQALASLSLARLLYTRGEAEGATAAVRAVALRGAEGLLDVVVKKHARVKLPDPEVERTAGEEAEPILFEIRNLAIGKIVPNLAGDDLDGKALKLSDYRGKVLLLDFWAFSSGASIALQVHERRLLARMKDRPFTIVGVNGDDPEELPDLLKKTKPPYRSLRNQRKDRADVSKEWNLKGWPTLFLIDHKGIIRHRWIGPPVDKVLDKAIDALVRTAEGEKK